MYDPEIGRFISRDPLGYVDGQSLYNAYFAQSFDLDPMGTESIKKEISFTEYDSDYNPTKKINIEVFFDSKCKDKIDMILKIISKLQMKSFVAVSFADQRDDEKWFGKLTKEQKKTVQENFQKTYNATVYKKLEFNCPSCCKGKNGREPAARVASGVGKGHGSIDLCPPFFNLDTSQQLSSLFHEYTHIAFESHDTGYKTGDPDVYNDPVYEGKTKKLKQEEKLINADTYSGAVNKIMSR